MFVRSSDLCRCPAKWALFTAFLLTFLLLSAVRSRNRLQQPKLGLEFQLLRRRHRKSELSTHNKLSETSRAARNGSIGPECVLVSSNPRTDCDPDSSATKERCLKRGCCWKPDTDDLPPCYVPVKYSGYKVISSDTTRSYTRLTLLRDLPCELLGCSTRVTVEISNVGAHTVRIKIKDKNARPYEAPVPPIPRQTYHNLAQYPVTVTSRDTLLIGRRNHRVLEFHVNSLILSDRLNQVKVQLPASIVYGLRSRKSSVFSPLVTSSHVFYADHRESDTLLPQSPGPTFYGGHPFFALLHTQTNTATGIFLLNSNEIGVSLADDSSATFRTTGGALDFFIFFGPTLSSVAMQYQKLVGFPGMPPYHLLRHRRTEEEVRSALWADFSVDGLKEAYNALSDGERFWNISSHQNILVQSEDGKPLNCLDNEGKPKYFMDFTHPAAETLCLRFLNDSQQFINTTIYTFNQAVLETPCCDSVVDSACASNTLHLSSYKNLRHAYPYLQARVISAALSQSTRSRAAIVSDKAFAGQGKWTGYWNLQSEASWKGLNDSLADLLRYSMWGIPLFGTSLCDFYTDDHANQNKALCMGWLTLAPFFPVYRYGISSEAKSISSAIAESTYVHYYLRSYLYTLLYQSSRYGNMVARPMAFEFQDEPGAREVDHQFMFGSSLLIVPKTLQDKTVREVYFPKGAWFDWQNGKVIRSGGQNIYVPAYDDRPGIYVRSGSIVPIIVDGWLSGESNRITLVVAPNEDGYASGVMYSDDGFSVDPIESEKFSLFNFILVKETLVGHCSPCNYQADSLLGMITFFGMRTRPTTASLNGKKMAIKQVRATMYVRSITHPLIQPFNLAWK